MVLFNTVSGDINPVVDMFIQNGFSVEEKTTKKAVLVYKGLLLTLFTKHNAGYTDILIMPNKRMLRREYIHSTDKPWMKIHVDFDKLKHELDCAATAKEVRISLSRGIAFQKTLMEAAFKNGTVAFNTRDAKGALILELTYPENTRIDIIISTHSNNDKNQFLDNWKDARCKLQLKRTITSYRRARSDLLRSVNMTLGEASEFIESKLISSIEKSKKASENIRLINKEVTEEFKSKSQSLTEELAELEKLCSDVKQKIRINDMNMRSEFERRAVQFKKQLFHENTVNKILNEEFPIDHDKCSENSLHSA